MPKNLLFALIANVLALAHPCAQAPESIKIPEDPFAAIEAMPIQDPVEGGLEVKVVDGDSKKPIAGANVLVFTNVDDDAARKRAQAIQKQLRGKRLDRRTMTVTMAAIMGTRYQTDSKGVARIPQAGRAAAVILHEKRFGRWHSQQEGPAELFAPRILKIEVSNARGKPARDVQLGVGNDSNYFHSVVNGTTDKDGRCEIDVSNLRHYDSLRVQAMIASDEEIFATIPKKLDEPVRLKLPPCGMVRFILYGDDDRPSNDLTQAVLHFTPKSDSGRRSGRRTSMMPTKQDPDGAMFSHVALGLDIKVWANIKGLPQAIEFKAKGPTREYEMIIVDGRLNAGPPIVSFRVLDQNGQPLINEPLGRVFYSERRHDFTDVKTDENGVLTLTLAKAPPEAVYLMRRSESEGSDYRGAVRFKLGELKPGRQKLADVRLQDEPVIASGTVVDEAGKPVADVWLKSKLTITTGSGGGSWSGEHFYYKHRVKTDEQGRFEIREVAAVDKLLKISVDGDDWILLDENVTLSVGDKGEVVKVGPATLIEGQLLGKPKDSQLQVKCVNRDTGREVSTYVRESKFSFEKLPPGDYDIQVGSSEDFVIENVRSKKSGEEQDPRLQTKDWQQHFQTLATTVTDESGKPLQNITVYYYVKRGRSSTGTGVNTDKNGKAHRLMPVKNVWVEVKANGYEPQKIEKDLVNLTVRMKPVAPIEVELVGLPELPHPTYAQVRASGGSYWREQEGRIKNGRTTVYPTKVGKVGIELRLGVDWVHDMPGETRNALRRAMNLKTIKFEVNSTRKPGPVQKVELDQDLIDDIKACIADAKEVLKKQVK